MVPDKSVSTKSCLVSISGAVSGLFCVAYWCVYVELSVPPKSKLVSECKIAIVLDIVCWWSCESAAVSLVGRVKKTSHSRLCHRNEDVHSRAFCSQHKCGEVSRLSWSKVVVRRRMPAFNASCDGPLEGLAFTASESPTSVFHCTLVSDVAFQKILVRMSFSGRTFVEVASRTVFFPLLACSC